MLMCKQFHRQHFHHFKFLKILEVQFTGKNLHTFMCLQKDQVLVTKYELGTL